MKNKQELVFIYIVLTLTLLSLVYAFIGAVSFDLPAIIGVLGLLVHQVIRK